jgi:hypothetical protein
MGLFNRLLIALGVRRKPEDVAKEESSAVDEEKVKERLKSLGYLD